MYLCRKCQWGFEYPETPRKSKCPTCGQRCPQVVRDPPTRQRRKTRPPGKPPAWDMLPRQRCPRPSLLDSALVSGGRRGTEGPDWIPGTSVHPMGGLRYEEDVRG